MKIAEVKVFVTGPRKSESLEKPTYRHDNCWAIHLLFAEVGILYAEYFIFGEPNQPNPDPVFTWLHAPQNGWFTPPPGIGAGIDFTPDAHEYLYEVTGALPIS